MTPLEAIIRDLKNLREDALHGDDAAKLIFTETILDRWPTIQHALEELNRRRIA